MKIQNLIGFIILIISIITYLLYPSVLLLLTIGALLAVLLIKTDFFNRITGKYQNRNQSGAVKASGVKTTKQKKKKK